MDRANSQKCRSLAICWPVIAEACVWFQGQSIWDLLWTKQHWDRFFLDYFHFPLLVSFHRCSQTYIAFLWHHQCYMLLEVDFVYVICMPNYMVPCPRSSFVHINHCEQLLQNCLFMKLNVLMEIPDLWLQTARVHLSSPNCCISGWT